MDVELGLHKYSLQATIAHGPSMYSGHYTTSINCWKRLQQQQQYFYYNDSKITQFEMIDTKKLLYW